MSYNQLIRPGAPVIFAPLQTSIDMNSGAPTFGTPEASRILYGAGNWRVAWDCHTVRAGALWFKSLMRRRPETSNTLNAALMGGGTLCCMPVVGWKGAWCSFRNS